MRSETLYMGCIIQYFDAAHFSTFRALSASLFAADTDIPLTTDGEMDFGYGLRYSYLNTDTIVDRKSVV